MNTLGLSPLQRNINIYYNTISKPPPKQHTVTSKRDNCLVGNILKGDCTVGYPNRPLLQSLITQYNITQPTSNIAKLWEEVVLTNSIKLPRYVSDFILPVKPYNDELRYVSPWLYAISQLGDVSMNNDEQYIYDLFTKYVPFYDNTALISACKYCYNCLSEFTKNQSFITKPSMNLLIDIIFEIWGSILGDLANLTLGHLRSQRLFTELLPMKCIQLVLTRGNDCNEIIITTSPPLVERITDNSIRNADWRELPYN